MTPLSSARPAIMDSAGYLIHETIEEFFKAMLETRFGPEPNPLGNAEPTRSIESNHAQRHSGDNPEAQTGGMF